jgi:lysophospholipase L1-like esterase
LNELRPFLFLLIVVFILAVGARKAKDLLPVSDKFYACINYDKNVIEPSTESSLSVFFKKLDRHLLKREGKINIVHIGDSHVQADYFCHSTRLLLQKTFGNGGRGFIFPHKLAKTNNAYSVGITGTGTFFNNKSISWNDHGTYGIAGVTLTTYDSLAEILIAPNKLGNFNYEFNKIRLFYEDKESNFGIKWRNGGVVPLDYDEISDGQGQSTFYLQKPVDSIWMKFDKSYFMQTEFKLHGMSFENQYPGLIYHGIGLNGAYAKSYLRNQFFSSELEGLNADLIILSLGTNDGYMSKAKFCISCFKDSYSALIKKIQLASPHASILITTPGDNFIRAKYHNQNVGSIVEAMYELAAEYDAGIWDFNKIMGGNYSMRAWQSHGLAQRDLVHFTEEGYNVMGTLLYEAIMKSYEKRFNQ